MRRFSLFNEAQTLFPRSKGLIVRKRFGLSLLEVILVIAIIAVLVGIMLPAIQKARDAAARASCQSKLRQLAIGVHGYAATNQTLPQGCSYPFLPANTTMFTQFAVSWQTNILPYIDQTGLWDEGWRAYSASPRGGTAEYDQVMASIVPLFLCPSEARRQGAVMPNQIWGLTSYQGIAGTGIQVEDGVFHPNFTVRFADIADGTSNTVMIGERPPGPKGIFGSWFAGDGACICPLSQILPAAYSTPLTGYGVVCISGPSLRPGNIDDGCSTVYFWSLHTNGANFAFADGSVHFLTYSQSNILPALATRDGGEPVSVD